MIRKFLNKKIRLINNYRELIYLRWLRYRNKNLNPTIVANNCVGGVIYHNLRLEFTSPTINLYINGDDYIEFVKNFEYYSHCQIEELKQSEFKFPVGKVLANDNKHKDIMVYFMHYTDFDDAKTKWEERYKRVDFNNVFYIWEFDDKKEDINQLREFDSLRDKKTLAITHKKIKGLKNACFVNCYNDDTPPGMILRYNKFTGKRYLEKVDYVKFLNQKTKVSQ